LLTGIGARFIVICTVLYPLKARNNNENINIVINPFFIIASAYQVFSFMA
jgi:hypothetical protein